jgi:hypothetical protein
MLICLDHGKSPGIELPDGYLVLLILPQQLPPISLSEGIQKKEANVFFGNRAVEITLNQGFHL